MNTPILTLALIGFLAMAPADLPGMKPAAVQSPTASPAGIRHTPQTFHQQRMPRPAFKKWLGRHKPSWKNGGPTLWEMPAFLFALGLVLLLAGLIAGGFGYVAFGALCGGTGACATQPVLGIFLFMLAGALLILAVVAFGRAIKRLVRRLKSQKKRSL